MLVLICFVISFILPLPELIVEDMSARLGRDDASSFKVQEIGREVARFMLVADSAEVFGTFDLTMSFFVAVAAGGGGVVDAIAVSECFFRGGADRGRDI